MTRTTLRQIGQITLPAEIRDALHVEDGRQGVMFQVSRDHHLRSGDWGPRARIVLPGKQRYGMIMTILLGVARALIGYWLWGLIGKGNTFGIDWIRWVIS
mgnify:CR=1 FL=1